ncbi:MAG: hypothetical protein Q8P99_02095 [bacterium]|nr:hypothetical protein [bacterium]MDZ4231433.1 hypothetical protein [Patescibacteria group bacterium]
MDQKTPEQLASQLEGLHAEVRQRVESIPTETAGEDLHKQTLHQVVGERLGKGQIHPATSLTSDVSDLPPEIQAKVEELVQRAVTKDLDSAIDEARKSGDSMVVDAFHDAVVGELYDRFVSEGKLKALDK